MKDDSAEEREGEFSDYLVGGIPPFLRFEIEYHSLFYLVESHKEDRWYPKGLQIQQRRHRLLASWPISKPLANINLLH